MRYEGENSFVSMHNLGKEHKRETGGKKRWKKGDRVWRRQQRRRSGACMAWESPVFVVCYRLVRLRKAQGHRPEGFTGLSFFLCGGSGCCTASTAPHASAWCPLRLKLHHWLLVMKRTHYHYHLCCKKPFKQRRNRGALQSHFHFSLQCKCHLLIFHFSTSLHHYRSPQQSKSPAVSSTPSSRRGSGMVITWSRTLLEFRGISRACDGQIISLRGPLPATETSLAVQSQDTACPQCVCGNRILYSYTLGWCFSGNYLTKAAIYLVPTKEHKFEIFSMWYRLSCCYTKWP